MFFVSDADTLYPMLVANQINLNENQTVKGFEFEITSEEELQDYFDFVGE